MPTSVYFSSDLGNHETYAHFYADLPMLATTPDFPGSQAELQHFVTFQMAQQANHWSGRNVVRWSNPA